MVRRIFVEKKKGFDVEAQSLCADIRENLGIKGLKGVRVLNRYDMDGLSDELYRKSVFDVFAEPALDTVTEEADLSDAAFVFASEYLPGQYDQRADSAAQCIQLISMGQKPEVKFSRVIALYEEMSPPQMRKRSSITVSIRWILRNPPWTSRKRSLSLLMRRKM